MRDYEETDRVGRSASEAPIGAPASHAVDSDIVFDFRGNDALDLRGLCLLLTARQMAHDRDQEVWITGFPERTWRILRALGLDDYFNVLPGAGESSRN